MEMKQNEVRPIISAQEIIPLHKDVLIQDMYFGEQITESGIVIIDDDKQTRGIHPRWAKVYAVGPENRDVKAGDWILIEHGRWSRGFDLLEQGITIRRVDPKAIMGIDPTGELVDKSCFVSD
jgi:co-chaperonin GroES (HSP10)